VVQNHDVLHFAYFSCKSMEKGSRRADSNRLYLLRLRVIGRAMQGFAQDCQYRSSKWLSQPRVAACWSVLRSRWRQSGVKRCQEFVRWRSHVFLRSLLVPTILSKRGIPPFDRFKLLFGQPFAYFGFEAEATKRYASFTMCSSHRVSESRKCSSSRFSITIWGSANSLLFTVHGV
jgi:hypothetical protein